MSDEEKLARIVEAYLKLILVLWMLWTLIPDHRRKLWRMALLDRARRSTGWAARRTGAASMRAELASGQQNYWLTWGLSVMRDRLAAAYDRTRGVTP